ncbi:reverse transcriptase domain-containing protein [Tanacetum coccineum]|uniref:Reverse transcriptase domain-containing protein n=1 Tax=Tanacetum coccineum TaxID=301880 RepID=A0ABQ5GGR2_9ASTR
MKEKKLQLKKLMILIMIIEEMIFPPIRDRAPFVDPILISVQVHGRHVWKVLLDGGAACDIIYEHCFIKLRKETRERMRDIYKTLSGLSGEQVKPLGEISLLITLGEPPHHKSEKITFLIVRSDSPNNMLLGRTKIAGLGMIPSMMHSAVLYQSEVGPRVIMSKYQDVRRCELVKRVKETPLEGPLQVSECFNLEEKIIINSRYPEQTMTIGRQLLTKAKQELIKLLKDNAIVFAWQYSDMTGIPRTLKIRGTNFITEHKLNEDKKITPVQHVGT